MLPPDWAVPLPSAFTWTLPGSRWWTPPRSMTSTPLMKTNVSSSPKNCRSNAPLNTNRSRASTENQASWNQPWLGVIDGGVGIQSPFGCMPNHAAGSTPGAKLGGKMYCAPVQLAPAPNWVELYQYGQRLHSNGSLQGAGVVRTAPGPVMLPVSV